MVAYYWVLNSASFIANLVGLFIFFTINNLLCITCYSNIGIVRYNDNLSFLFCSANARNKFTVNRLIIKVVLWLVNNNRLTFFTKR